MLVKLGCRDIVPLDQIVQLGVDEFDHAGIAVIASDFTKTAEAMIFPYASCSHCDV